MARVAATRQIVLVLVPRPRPRFRVFFEDEGRGTRTRTKDCGSPFHRRLGNRRYAGLDKTLKNLQPDSLPAVIINAGR